MGAGRAPVSSGRGDVPSIVFEVNGVSRSVPRAPERSLLLVLREELGLTGTKYGCGEGECGACKALLDGVPVRACKTPIGEVAHRSVRTVEGLSEPGRLNPVQEAFCATGALQCGFCIPGMVVTATALLARSANPSEGEIRDALDGNICRCCGYPRILEAVRRAATGTGTLVGTPGPDGPVPGDLPAAEEGGGPAAPYDRSPPEGRDYFARFGPGLVVVQPPRGAGPSGWGPGGPPIGGAWVHLGEAGRVRAFSGKVEVGQGTSTVLALLVAEELRVPLAAVDMVLGDTDLCPWDMGTFGSRSMPDAAPQLRVAAATLRGRLAELAGARLGATPDQVLLSDGVARIGAGADPRAAGGIPYGDLVRGLRRLDVVSTPSAPTPPAAWRLAGRPTVNGGGAEIVTGRRRYTSDLHLPGMLHGRILFPPAYGAKLVRADLARARAWPEVVVLQEADFVGVAAPDLLQARSALRAIEVEWTLSPSQPTEGELVAYLERHRDEDPDAWDVVRVRTGEPGKAFATAATTLKGRYTAAYIAHTPLETHATVAAWSPDGRLSIWVGAQTPFRVRETVARALGLPVEKVRVRVPPTGAGFGGKHAGELATAAARLARASGRPVRIVYTREEEFQQGYFRPFAAIDLAAGLDGEGRLVAWDHRVLNAGGAGARSPYGVAHASIESVPCASPLPQGPYRALAATANNFARESLMDEVAHRAGADPVAYRLQALQDERLRAVLRAVADRVGWAPSDGPPRAPGRGRGIAVGLEKGGRVATYAEVAVDEGHRVEVRRLVTGFECGAIVHPANLRSQVEGGTIMALGGALFEAVRFDRGRVLNPRLSMYRVPRLRDVPDLEVLLLDRKDLPSEGAGEAPLIAVAPAVANAIFNATGQRIRSMPMVPDGILPPPAP